MIKAFEIVVNTIDYKDNKDINRYKIYPQIVEVCQNFLFT